MFEYNYKLVKVVDGDTIDVDIDLGFGVWLQKQRIRMMGIDTPESRTSDKEEKVYGLLAKEKLQTLLATGKVLKTYKDAKGKFGRILGELWVNCTEDGHEFNGWTNINKWMCESGYAVGYHGQNKDDVETAHMENRKLLLEEKGIKYEEYS